MILKPNTLLADQYLIVKMIARGGMGAVYKASDQKSGKTVALKQSLVKDQKLAKAFEREARMLSRLRHPVLPVVSQHFVNEAGQFLVMQFIPGDDLGTILSRQSKKFLSANAIPWVLSWADQLLDALAYLHSQEYPVIHRDIKPQNLKITARGEIKLLDFGLAKSAIDHTLRSAVQSVRGYTPQYASLEQIQGTGTEPCSDLYSLGATLYHLLTGQSPIDALERISARLRGDEDPLSPPHEINPLVPHNVSLVLQQAMEQEKEHRFASATAMRTALRMAGHGYMRTSPSKRDGSNQEQAGSSKQPEARHDGSSGMQTIISVDDAADGVAQSQSQQQSEPSQHKTSPSTQVADTTQPYPTLVVAPQGYAHYKTLGEALLHAEAGTRIVIHPGTYKEGVLLDKHVEIIGDGPLEKIIIESNGTHCVQMQTDYALLRGVTIRARGGARKNPCVAVDIPRGRLVLESCDISSETQTGIAVHGSSSNPLIWKCRIHDVAGIGVSFSEQARGMLEECDIFGNSVAGIGIVQASNPVIRHCTIHHGKQDGVYIGDQSAGMIENCDIYENERAGIEIKQKSVPFIRGCSIHEQVKGYGIYVYEEGEGIIEDCKIFENNEGGIGITRDGNPLIRRCQIHNEKQRGIIISDSGRGTIEECDIFKNVKMGAGITKHANPTLRKCHIRESGHVGLMIWDNGAGMIEECTIVDNAQAGVEIGHYGNPFIHRCSIQRNKQVGIVARKDSTGNVENCQLTDNRRGAWAMEEGSLVLGSENTE